MIKFRYANFVSTNPPMCPRPPVHSIIDQSKFVTHSSFKHRQKKPSSKCCQQTFLRESDNMTIDKRCVHMPNMILPTINRLLYWINMDVSEDYD
uniref:Uncharacterized protein n=1 Tax=Globodera rostochiensis TaxID=31243 RepID=A0A914I5H8_GLORO